MAYHDSDAVNSGSGMLNPGDSNVDRFRKEEAVDISYTKLGIDKDQWVEPICKALIP